MKKLRIFETKDGKLVVVNSNDEVVFEVYKGDNLTPGGVNESFNYTSDHLLTLLRQLKGAGININEFKSGKDFQESLYNLALKTPEGRKSIEDMWGTYGMTLHGVNDVNVRKFLESKGVSLQDSNRGYKLNFSNVSEADKLSVLTYLKDKGYSDDKVGVRTLSVNPSVTVKKEPTPTIKTNPEVKSELEEPISVDDLPIDWGAIQEKRDREDGMWLQDRINILGAYTDSINKYKPYLSKLNLDIPEYSLLDPSRGIANYQSQMSNNKDMIMNNALLPNLGVSAALALNSENSDKIADYISNVENQNVSIANSYSSNNSQINNNEISTNENYKQLYNTQTATLNQQYDNAVRDLKWKRINALNQGLENLQIKKSLSAIYPQVWQNPLTYDVDIINGKNPFGSVFDPISYFNANTKRSDNSPE